MGIISIGINNTKVGIAKQINNLIKTAGLFITIDVETFLVLYPMVTRINDLEFSYFDRSEILIKKKNLMVRCLLFVKKDSGK